MNAEQAQEALAVANDRRRALLSLKQEVVRGDLSFVDACTDPRVGSMLVWDLLMLRHGCGERKAVKAMRELGLVNPRKRMRDLTSSQLERMMAL